MGFDPVLRHTLKQVLCHTRLVGGMYDKYQNSLLALIGREVTAVLRNLIAAVPCFTTGRLTAVNLDDNSTVPRGC